MTIGDKLAQSEFRPCMLRSKVCFFARLGFKRSIYGRCCLSLSQSSSTLRVVVTGKHDSESRATIGDPGFEMPSSTFRFPGETCAMPIRKSGSQLAGLAACLSLARR